MEAKKGKKVSRKTAKKYFTHVGMFLLMYTLSVLIIPYFFNVLIQEAYHDIAIDKLFYYGIYFIIILFGTFIPFFLLRLYTRIPQRKFLKGANISIVDVFVETIVCFTVTILLTYVSNIIFGNFGLGNKLISSIGFSFDSANLSYWLYLVMFIVATPILEEYAFRGVLLSALGKYGKLFGLIASSFFFAIAHNNAAEIIPAFAMGYLLGCATLRYKSILPSIFIHILFNLFIYGLCVLPTTYSQYMTYGLVFVFLLALFLIVTGRYQRVQIQTLVTRRRTSFLFYTRWSVFLTILLMIFSTVLFSMNFLL